MKACKHDDIESVCVDCLKDKLKFVMEAVGECWHEYNNSLNCDHCSDTQEHTNPSPDDMNKLMELAEKLDAFVILHFGRGDVSASVWVHLKGHTKVEGGTPAEALLNALFVAKGGLEDE